MEVSNTEAKQRILKIKKERSVKGLRVPVKRTNFYHKALKKVQKVYEPVGLQKIESDGEHHKVILLSPQFEMEELHLTPEQSSEVTIANKAVILTHSNLSCQELFNEFQNPELECIPYPNSFQTAGHIAHYNLTPQQHPYRHIIGEITLLKCPSIKTVVHKSQKLHNIYRTPTLELMAGEHNYEVKMKQVGVVFLFDFEKVYWCSRLQKERDRLLEQMKQGELLVDLFCGVGPLAVRAAKQGLYVVANDLNPHCHEYLEKNCEINQVKNKTFCWNMCAREAMRKLYADKEHMGKHFSEPDHIYMNLPVDAIQFLDVLATYEQDMGTKKMPLVHVNCFVVADSDEKSLELLGERVGKVLPGFKKEDVLKAHHIKNVTIIMRMYCLTFKLKPKYVEQVHEVEDVVEKKIKVQ